ncbi:heavy metal translocating P-type ATPase [Mailhella sp.]|uniref:heavy metal translocating P-type ATPase n=1 Tax=Mailhella sp. TaxID=1981029 RepID=UPI0040638347
MEKHPHTPFGHGLEAFTPSKAAPLVTLQPHGHVQGHIESGSGLLNVQCSCGGACCSGGHEQDRGHDHGHDGGISWKKLAIAGLFAALSEAFHFALDDAAFSESVLRAWTLGGVSLLEVLPLLFALLAIALSGVETYKAGWRSVRSLDLNMTALMSVAVTGAVLIGQFPEAAMVMVLYNVSEAIEGRVILRARRAVKELLALSPETATVRQPDGSWRETDCRAVALGAMVRVRPGERIALDGIVRQGRSAVDQAPITGESMPVEKGPGDTVFAGTVNTSGSFEFEVTARAADTTLSRIIHAVEQAQASRAPIQRFVDGFARWYTPCIFAASLLLALVPPLTQGAAWIPSIYRALVVLVIGCPCALVISTPVTIVSGLAAATRAGMLVKGGVFLEQGRLLRVLALDKTGTLTHGRPRLTDVCVLYGSSAEQNAEPNQEIEMRLIAASLAARSDHPVSRAVAEGLSLERLLNVQEFEARPGQGVCGTLDGESWYLGSMRMMESLGFTSEREGAEALRRAAELEVQGRTVVALAGRGRIRALIAVADTIRESSIEAVRELRALGVKTVMLTGDNENAARVIAEQAGVDEFHARLMPEDKLAVMDSLVETLRGGRPDGGRGMESSRGKAGMAGDGINDAPALARADIGFAMAKGGTDTAMETADVALMDDDLRKIPRFVRLSRRVHGILMQNIALALGVKVLFFILTLCGCTSMWMAVFADVGTALMVVGNGLRAGHQ